MKNKILLLLLFSIMVFLAIKEGLSEDQQGDFYIFWSAGLNFLEGKALYAQIGGAEEFLYPPFAPMVFQILAWIPFNIAACIFSFFNLVGWFGVLFLAKKILETYYPSVSKDFSIKIFSFTIDYKKLQWLIFLITIRYFWHNFIWVNINVLVTLLTFGGILLYLRNRLVPALICITIATFLKVMPGLLLLVIAFHNPPKTWLKMIGIAFGLLGLVLIFRGWTRGIGDFTDFYQLALVPFLLGGKVYIDWIALSIPSMLFKLFTATPIESSFYYNVLDLPKNVVKNIATFMQVTTVALVLKEPILHFFSNIFKGKLTENTQIPLKTWCMAYCAMVLVAGVSWEGHHITLALVFPSTILLIGKKHKFWRNALIIIALLISLMAKDLIGSWLYNYSMVWSFITMMMLFIFFLLNTKTGSSSVTPREITS
jgi:Glycosyltransferase family 87